MIQVYRSLGTCACLPEPLDTTDVNLGIGLQEVQSLTKALRGKEAVKEIPVGKIQLLRTQDSVFLYGQFYESGLPLGL